MRGLFISYPLYHFQGNFLFSHAFLCLFVLYRFLLRYEQAIEKFGIQCTHTWTPISCYLFTFYTVIIQFYSVFRRNI